MFYISEEKTTLIDNLIEKIKAEDEKFLEKAKQTKSDLISQKIRKTSKFVKSKSQV
ncbi:hypothetical protein [Mesomycoplasma ovipneumoniae]|uniref:Uncharacterized protein n=1 Tax=Mesomycoplasma ovipneumoniae TaxID=29562 RepID=A0AAW6Q901_9BACT|nr:hypothetical protein [Mesomycoplasma ovipneumoniae]MDF9627772.1 hypothetical protein [Mesomycoplasma ovipneumoniae]MDO4157915.1 hypothetical protein [Mesomycoplasma ovipneumoniae]MDO4158279.1 hypothetical protein [Mesomycoplasma ovipneumoniae]MDO6821633.1 hypothetical protein [Mesomycoplasma ovipneumoniae]MDO6855558.1 hypothetical protein [Mesomycoplasma ovipneumoniae]